MKDIRFNIPLTDEELEDRGIEISFNENELIMSFENRGNIIKTDIKGTTYSISVITDREELLLIDILNIESKRIQLYSIKPDFDDSGSLAVIKIKNYDKKQISYLPGDSVCIYVKNKGDE